MLQFIYHIIHIAHLLQYNDTTQKKQSFPKMSLNVLNH